MHVSKNSYISKSLLVIDYLEQYCFFLQTALVLSAKPRRKWRDSMADVFSCHEPDATGSSGSPRPHKWDRTAAMSPSVPVLLWMLVRMHVQVRPRSTPQNWSCHSMYLVIPLSGFPCYKLCNLITHACLINFCHGRVAHHSRCHHLVRSSSHSTPTQGL